MENTSQGEFFVKKLFSVILIPAIILFALSGCVSVGNKTASMSVAYGVTSALSLLLLILYCSFIKQKEAWFLLLFASVFIVNAGYFSLAVSQTIEEALLANRIAYLGSVFLPFSMFMIILNISGVKYRRLVPFVLLMISMGVFFVAASPGYLDIYYKSVSLGRVCGVTVLEKEYGAWHCLYLYYLLLYFAVMTCVILYATLKKRHNSVAQAVVLLIAVFVNLCVWFLEQLVKIDFEILSVSYIISELFLIGIYLMIQDVEVKKQDNAPAQTEAEESFSGEAKAPVASASDDYIERCIYLRDHVSDLTATERAIYNSYLAGKSTKDIMNDMNITENTLKFHNKNLYSKLGVRSRKQILEYVRFMSEMKPEQ